MTGHENDTTRTDATRTGLALVAAALCVILVAGTVYALAADTRGRALARRAAAAERAGVATATATGSRTDDAAVYDGIGIIRAQTADASVVVVSVSFPYDGADRAFSEELFDKRDALRAACRAYFSRRTADELHPAFLGQTKAELRDIINAALSLGRIETVYFGDFSVIK